MSSRSSNVGSYGRDRAKRGVGQDNIGVVCGLLQSRAAHYVEWAGYYGSDRSDVRCDVV